MPGTDKEFQIFVKTISGEVTLDVKASDRILFVKAQIQDKEGIPPEKIRLVYKGQKLRGPETLASHGIVDDDGKRDYTIFGVTLPETIPLPPTATSDATSDNPAS